MFDFLWRRRVSKTHIKIASAAPRTAHAIETPAMPPAFNAHALGSETLPLEGVDSGVAPAGDTDIELEVAVEVAGEGDSVPSVGAPPMVG